MTGGERKDLELYAYALRTAAGEVFGSESVEEVPKEYVSYVENATLQSLEALPINFSYERWLAGPAIG